VRASAQIPAPAFAEGFDIVGGLVNITLLAIVLGFVAYIVSFAAEAVTSLGETGEAISKSGILDGSSSPRGSSEPVYDDSGSGAVSDAQVGQELASRKKRGKGVSLRLLTLDPTPARARSSPSRPMPICQVRFKSRRPAKRSRRGWTLTRTPSLRPGPLASGGAGTSNWLRCECR
jgi:hypothetical protein